MDGGMDTEDKKIKIVFVQPFVKRPYRIGFFYFTPLIFYTAYLPRSPNFLVILVALRRWCVPHHLTIIIVYLSFCLS